MTSLRIDFIKVVLKPREVLLILAAHLAVLTIWWIKQYWAARLQFPGPTVKNVWTGNLDQTMMPDIHKKWRTWHRQYGPIFQTWNSLLSRVIYIGDPAMIHTIATENWEKASSQYEGFRPLSGDALFMPKAHTKWLRQRKSLSPAFGPQVIRMQYPTLRRYITEYTQQIATASTYRQSIDLSMLHVLLTLDFVGEIAFGSELHALATGPNCRILQLFKLILPELMKCGLFPLRAKIPILQSTRDMHKAIKELRKMAESTVLDARRTDMVNGTKDKPPRRIFEILVRQKEPNGRYTFSTRDLVDNYGGDPTAHTLSFAVYEVLRKPVIHATLVQELLEALPSLDEIPSVDRASKLPYLNAVIKETLRYNGPGFGTFRTCAKDTEVCGVTLPGKTTLVLWNPQVHRDPKIWGPTADVFDPSRWLDPNFRPPPGSYFPFSYGPRICLGQGLAMFEISLTLATLFRQFDLSLQDGFVMELDPAFTLCPKNGLPVFATRRPC
ncbi:cytochrome P450 [Cryphonectria parasitica EP155]|uniref:Cytochrome P450 n=1 Tax=Cryphonectria parasitica (strain ATCC 38755 / EP155) TaxID=660469 RepID=A0A9P5CKV0_CRYP1|nr:cytochrome P450 [Cryphonectria parasitica EP155]KAF3761346.1 cytochrome P450 [Cryphonectria parasitica EP155]